jgi:hypothetical protein
MDQYRPKLEPIHNLKHELPIVGLIIICPVISDVKYLDRRAELLAIPPYYAFILCMYKIRMLMMVMVVVVMVIISLF